MDCAQLTAGLVAAECNKSVTSGVEDEVVLLNFNEVDKANSVVTQNVISQIMTKSSKKGFKFATFGKSMNDSGVTFTKGTYRNTVLQNLFLRVFVKTEKVKEFANSFVSGAKVIAIVKNKEAGPNGEVRYEAYGWDNGLELNELTGTLEMTDGVVYALNIGSSETAQEGSLPKSVFIADLTSTEKMIDSLVA